MDCITWRVHINGYGFTLKNATLTSRPFIPKLESSTISDLSFDSIKLDIRNSTAEGIGLVFGHAINSYFEKINIITLKMPRIESAGFKGTLYCGILGGVGVDVNLYKIYFDRH